MTDNTLVVNRRFAAPREAVFDAWTAPEAFAAWFGGAEADVPVETVALDVRVGGAWSAVMHLPGGHVLHWGGEYTEVKRPSRLAFTMSDEPGAPAGDPITVDLREVDGGTELTLVQTGTADFTSEQYDMTVAGYEAYFDALESVLVPA